MIADRLQPKARTMPSLPFRQKPFVSPFSIAFWTDPAGRAIANRIATTSRFQGMKTYHGRRTEHGCAVDVEEDGECTVLNPRNDLRLHSSEVNWGYGGSGPAQLALALAADVLGDDDKALEIHQRLKFKLVGRLPHEGWILTEAQVRMAIDAIEQERERSR